MILFYLLGCAAGAILTVQTSVNTGLRAQARSIYMASLISFSTSALVFLFILLITGQLFIPFSSLLKEPPWIWFGGVLGILYQMECILLFPRLGSAQTVMLPAFGQILMGMAIDKFGLFGTPVSDVTLLRLGGAVLVLAGIVIFSMQKPKTGIKRPDRGLVLWGLRILGLVGGAMSASQSAINGHMGILTGNVFRAALINCVVGVCLIVVICLILKARGKMTFVFPKKGPWWIWSGGFMGAFFVGSTTFLAPAIGVGLTSVLSQSGSIGASLAVDHFGVLGAAKDPFTPLKGLSVALLITGIIIIRLF